MTSLAADWGTMVEEVSEAECMLKRCGDLKLLACGAAEAGQRRTTGKNKNEIVKRAALPKGQNG